MAATTAGPTSENDAPQDREHRAHLASGVKRRKVRRPGRVRRRCLPPGGQPPPIRAEPQRAEARAKMGEDGPLGGVRRIGDIPTITIPSALPDASSRPSGLNATATTVLPWPVMAAISAGCSGSMASHKITIRSAPPEASNCSSGLNATAHTALARRASVAIRPGGGGGGKAVVRRPQSTDCSAGGHRHAWHVCDRRDTRHASHESTRAHPAPGQPPRHQSPGSNPQQAPRQHQRQPPRRFPGQPQPPEQPCTQGQGNQDPDIRGHLAACTADAATRPARLPLRLLPPEPGPHERCQHQGEHREGRSGEYPVRGALINGPAPADMSRIHGVIHDPEPLTDPLRAASLRRRPHPGPPGSR